MLTVSDHRSVSARTEPIDLAIVAIMIHQSGVLMRRLTITGPLLVGLIGGLGLAGTPADATVDTTVDTAVDTAAAAVARTRVKIVITSLSGRRILVDRDVLNCSGNRLDRPGNCRYNEKEIRTRRYSGTVRIRRNGMALLDVITHRGRFRMQVYVNGVKRLDRKAAWRDRDRDGVSVWLAGIVVYGSGAIALL